MILNSEPFAIACSIIIFSTCDSVSVPFLFFTIFTSLKITITSAENLTLRLRADAETGTDTRSLSLGPIPRPITESLPGPIPRKSGRSWVKSDRRKIYNRGHKRVVEFQSCCLLYCEMDDIVLR